MNIRQIAWVSIFVALVSALVGSVWYGVDYMQCEGFAESTHANAWRYNWGCYVMLDNGRWVPKDYVYGEVTEIRAVQQ